MMNLRDALQPETRSTQDIRPPLVETAEKEKREKNNSNPSKSKLAPKSYSWQTPIAASLHLDTSGDGTGLSKHQWIASYVVVSEPYRSARIGRQSELLLFAQGFARTHTSGASICVEQPSLTRGGTCRCRQYNVRVPFSDAAAARAWQGRVPAP